MSFACSSRPRPRPAARASPPSKGLDTKEAEKAVEDADAARADYLRRFYGEKAELPTHYDIVVNTDRVTSAEAVSLVVHAARG